MPNIRSLTMAAPQVRALLREAEAPGTGMSRHAVPIKPQPYLDEAGWWRWRHRKHGGALLPSGDPAKALAKGCPHAPGDMIVCKETWLHADSDDGLEVIYAADNQGYTGPWRASTAMPRELSRLTLIVTDVQARRLHEAISCAQAIAEGVPRPANELTIDCDTPDPRKAYAKLWDARHGERYPWSSNPWCWWLGFRPIARNVADVVAEMGEAA